jgi:hypothetical protein
MTRVRFFMPFLSLRLLGFAPVLYRDTEGKKMLLVTGNNDCSMALGVGSNDWVTIIWGEMSRAALSPKASSSFPVCPT